MPFFSKSPSCRLTSVSVTSVLCRDTTDAMSVTSPSSRASEALSIVIQHHMWEHNEACRRKFQARLQNLCRRRQLSLLFGRLRDEATKLHRSQPRIKPALLEAMYHVVQNTMKDNYLYPCPRCQCHLQRVTEIQRHPYHFHVTVMCRSRQCLEKTVIEF